MPEEIEGQETEPEETSPEAETPEEKTLTAEEKLEALETKLTNAEAKAEEKDKGFRTLQGTFKETQRQLKEQQNIASEIQDLREQMKLVAAYVATSSGEEEESLVEPTPKKREDLLSKFDQLEKKRKAKAQQTQFVSQIAEYQKRTEGLGLTEDDDAYWEIEDLVTRGNFRRADIKLKKLGDAKTKEKEPVGDIEKEVKKQVNEGVNRYLVEHGYLSSDTGQPAGATGRTYTREEIASMPIKEYTRNKPDIDKALKEGRVK